MASVTTMRDRSAVDWALFVARVIVGVIFVAHGAQKLLGAFGGPGLAAVVQMMGPLGYLVTIGEFFGGLGLIFGLLTRVAAFGVFCNMVVAVAMVHRQFGFFMNWTGAQKGEGYEYHLLALAVTAFLMVRGAGAASADRLLSSSANDRLKARLQAA